MMQNLTIKLEISLVDMGANGYWYDKSIMDLVKWINDHETNIFLFMSSRVYLPLRWETSDWCRLLRCRWPSSDLPGNSEMKTHWAIKRDRVCLNIVWQHLNYWYVFDGFWWYIYIYILYIYIYIRLYSYMMHTYNHPLPHTKSTLGDNSTRDDQYGQPQNGSRTVCAFLLD